MAAAAGGGNVRVVDWRLGIARALNLVDVAVAILATGGNLPVLIHLRVDAVRICPACINVALRAGDLFRRLTVRQALYILVAIHAVEQAAVDGVFELVLVDEKAYGRAVYILRERGIAVTGEAVGVLELLRGMCG